MKRVLIITYYWPPAGGPGVQRWLKFVKYLRDYGIQPIVYFPKNPNYPIVDETLLAQVPEGIITYSHSIIEPSRWAGLLSKEKTQQISSGIIPEDRSSFLDKTLLWIRGNFFIPDARKFWIKPSVRFLRSVIEKERVEKIITTGPPHSVHLIGLELKKKLDLTWLADFRDPWTSIGYHDKLKLSKRAMRNHKKLESEVLNTADKIIVTSKTTKNEFHQLTTKPISVITNGYDFENNKSYTLDKEFTLSHIGSLLSGRNPENLWKALSELVVEHNAFSSHLQLKLIGEVSKEVLESIYKHDLERYLTVIPYVPHVEAIVLQQQSQILLLMEIDSDVTKGIVPGKLFEYMAAKRPILAIGPENWEAGHLIKDANAGVVFTYNVVSALKEVLLEWFDEYQAGALVVNSTDIQKYSRRELTKQLAAELQWE